MPEKDDLLADAAAASGDSGDGGDGEGETPIKRRHHERRGGPARAAAAAAAVAPPLEHYGMEVLMCDQRSTAASAELRARRAAGGAGGAARGGRPGVVREAARHAAGQRNARDAREARWRAASFCESTTAAVAAQRALLPRGRRRAPRRGRPGATSLPVVAPLGLLLLLLLLLLLRFLRFVGGGRVHCGDGARLAARRGGAGGDGRRPVALRARAAAAERGEPARRGAPGGVRRRGRRRGAAVAAREVLVASIPQPGRVLRAVGSAVGAVLYLPFAPVVKAYSFFAGGGSRGSRSAGGAEAGGGKGGGAGVRPPQSFVGNNGGNAGSGLLSPLCERGALLLLLLAHNDRSGTRRNPFRAALARLHDPRFDGLFDAFPLEDGGDGAGRETDPELGAAQPFSAVSASSLFARARVPRACFSPSVASSATTPSASLPRSSSTPCSTAAGGAHRPRPRRRRRR